MPSALEDYLFDLRGYLILENAVAPDLLDRLNGVLDEFPELEWQQWHGNVQRFDRSAMPPNFFTVGK